jgi:hypothetical protein
MNVFYVSTIPAEVLGRNNRPISFETIWAEQKTGGGDNKGAHRDSKVISHKDKDQRAK